MSKRRPNQTFEQEPNPCKSFCTNSYTNNTEIRKYWAMYHQDNKEKVNTPFKGDSNEVSNQ